ncbi:hypothetical protein, partial [Microcystis aeruginosa]|uniref:hypothetical protein n=1 Tax=Microcystis aeruginosa TaxID=1126 RepID=UPI001C0F24D2
YFEYKYSIYSLLCDAVALAGAHFVACLKLCFCLYHLLLFKMRIAGHKYSSLSLATVEQGENQPKLLGMFFFD